MKLGKKRGFTIVEMLMVIAVLAVLVGIVSTAATSVIRKSRSRKNEALCATLQAGIATYYQQEGVWPPDKNGSQNGALQRWAVNGLDAKYRSKGVHVAKLEDQDYDALMNALVTRCLSASGNPVMDVSGFTAVRKSATAAKGNDGLPKCYGEEVKSWVAKLKGGSTRGSAPQPNEMTFGYSSPDNGYFRRFAIKYNSESDSVTVEVTDEQ